MSRPTVISRRAMLRGAAAGATVALALPPLEAMFDGNGAAYADGEAIPKRFGVFFWGNHPRPEHWLPPSAPGADWAPSAALAPLAAPALKPYVSVVTGMQVKTGRTNPATGAALYSQHLTGQACILTGADFARCVPAGSSTHLDSVALPSVDQIAADYFARRPETRTRLRSLELAACALNPADNVGVQRYISHNGYNSPNPPEYSARAVFARLFGAGAPDPRLERVRGSILDLVAAQTQALQRDLGRHDQQRLDQYLESVRSIEQRLAITPSTCRAPAPPVDVASTDGREPIAAKHRLMADLLVAALACRQTHVFSYMFSNPACQNVFPGTNDGLHSLCHGGAAPQFADQVQTATVFIMQQFAYLLEALRRVPEGAATLLDHCAILGTAELWETYATGEHRYDQHPILVAGRAGGALRAGVHAGRPGPDNNASRVVLTLLRAVGVPRGEFGCGAGRATLGVPALEAAPLAGGEPAPACPTERCLVVQ